MRKRVSCWGVLFVLITVTAGNSIGEEMGNILDNPSFEVDPVGHRGTPAFWNWTREAEKYLQIVADSPGNELGKKSLLIDFRNGQRSAGDWYIWSSLIPIEDAETYRQSCWMKTDGLIVGFGATFGRQFFDSKKKPIEGSDYHGRSYTFGVHNMGPVKWTHFSQVLVPERTPGDGNWKIDEIPRGACYVQIWAGASGYPARVWFDCLRFEPFRETAGPLEIGANRIARIIESDTRIEVDGKLNEDVWQTKGEWIDGFCRTFCSAEDASEAENQTRFKVAGDKDNVYFAVICDAAEPDKIASPPREHNDIAVFNDDAVEIFLDAGGQKKLYLHLGINPSGALYEEWYSRKVNLGISTAANVTPKGWQVEIAVPRDELWQLYNEAGSGVDGKLWNLNITRHQPNAGKDSFTSWSYTGAEGFHNVDTLGFLLLDDPKAIAVERISQINTQLHRDAFGDIELDDEKSDLSPQARTIVQEIKKLLQSQNAILAEIQEADYLPLAAFARSLQESIQSFQF